MDYYSRHTNVSYWGTLLLQLLLRMYHALSQLPALATRLDGYHRVDSPMQEEKTKLKAEAASRGLVRLGIVPSVYYGSYFGGLVFRAPLSQKSRDTLRVPSGERQCAQGVLGLGIGWPIQQGCHHAIFHYRRWQP